MFDKKLLIMILATIVALSAVKYLVMNENMVFGINFLIFFVAGCGMMVLMHWVGYMEGLSQAKEDFDRLGKKKAFFFIIGQGSD